MGLESSSLFDLTQTSYAALFESVDNPWEVLPRIEAYADDYSTGDRTGAIIHETAIIDEGVTIGEGTTVGPYAVIKGPTIIGKNCEIRAHALIRGKALIGDNVVIGNSTEIKNALIFNEVKLPHFNYVGDSILGYKAHFGGGAATANYKSDGSEISVMVGDTAVKTGLTKLGGLIGDNVELGGNAFLNPGTIIGRNSIIYSGAIIRGNVAENVIVKLRQDQEIVTKL